MKFQSLGWEDPLEQEMATNSSIFFFFQVESLLTYLFFNWRKIALQFCEDFCHTTMQISHNYTYMASLLSPYSTPLGHQNARLGSPCYIENSHQLPILHMVVCICLCYFLLSSHSHLPLLCPQVHSLYPCLHSFSANRFINIIFLDSIYICVNIQYLFSLSELLHSV